MERGIIEVFSELGRRMTTHGEGDVHLAARNIAVDMLSTEALRKWIALYPALPVGEPRNVLIIMAGNIPFVGMHDLVCVLAAGHRAIVKPSSKDIGNMSRVVEQLLDIAPDLPVSLIDNDNYPLNAVIAMGGSETVAAIAEKYAGIPMLLRGNRSSLAVLEGGETAEELEGLADDVLMYSGLGCRNVSLVWVPRGYDFSALRQVLARRADSLGKRYRGNLRQARAMLRMGGAAHIDCGASLMVEADEFPAQPSILNYAFYDDMREVTDWIAAHDHEIQCVATNSSLFEARHCEPERRSNPDIETGLLRRYTPRNDGSFHSRTVMLGQTQRPGLTDYPDGRDAMKFLQEI